MAVKTQKPVGRFASNLDQGTRRITGMFLVLAKHSKLSELYLNFNKSENIVSNQSWIPKLVFQ